MAIHTLRLWWIAITLLLCTSHIHCRNFTNEDMRDAMLSLAHKMRSFDDKLERHEYREKALGDQVKKLLMGLDKKHRALEPLKGMISRLDERLSNVETILLQKEDREKSIQKKTNEALEGIQNAIQSLALNLTQSLTPAKSTTEIDNNLTTNEDSLERRLETTDTKLDAVKMEIENLKKSLNKDTLRDICRSPSDDKPQKNLIPEVEDLLNRYELKLKDYNVTSCSSQSDLNLNEVALADEAWHNRMSEVMERQENEIKRIQRLLSDAESMWKDLPRLADLNRITNHTLEAVINATEQIKVNDEKSVNTLSTKLREMGDRLVGTNEDIQRSLTQGNTLTERVYNDISHSYETLRTEVQTLTKSEHVMLQTADNVIANKKRIEYGVHQILTEVRELIKLQAKNMNRTVNDRFDNIETTIIDNQSGSFGNLSTKIESEVSQVWRQIGIMHQQLTSNRGALDKLTEETEKYVNSSTTTMNKVKDEVGGITTRVVELGDNLNYVLGRLSLVTQEFSQISTGLAEALTNLKADFQSVQAKLEDSGPGPHNITTTATVP